MINIIMLPILTINIQLGKNFSMNVVEIYFNGKTGNSIFDEGEID